MTARIYTIPARDVVPGMLLWNFVARKWWRLLSVEQSDGYVDYTQCATDGHDAGGAIECSMPVEVMLPGNAKSPRELLCSCSTVRPIEDPAMDPAHHWDDCPVRKLRLRLWPVGATWSVSSKIWKVPITQMGVANVRASCVLDDFARWPQEDARLLRAAFCEPEVQL